MRPLSTNALRGAAQASHEEMEAWLAKQHPVLTREVLKGKAEGKAEGLATGLAAGKAEGKAEGLRVAIEDLCEVLGVALDERRRAPAFKPDLAGLSAPG